MRHGQNSFVVKLVLTVQFAIDVVTGSTASDALWTATLGDKSGNDPMELQAVVKAFFSEFDKIGHRVGSVFFKKLHLQGALVCRNGCVHGSWDSVNLRLLEARQSYHESVEVVDLAMGGGSQYDT